MSIALGQNTGVIAQESLKVAVIDTTIMPKTIAYPNDARLAGRCHRQLVDLAKDEGIKFRQTLCKGLTGMVWQVGRYAHARQFKRRHTSKMPEHLLNDRGYRGSESTFLSKIHITGKRRGRGAG